MASTMSAFMTGSRLQLGAGKATSFSNKVLIRLCTHRPRHLPSPNRRRSETKLHHKALVLFLYCDPSNAMHEFAHVDWIISLADAEDYGHAPHREAGLRSLQHMVR